MRVLLQAEFPMVLGEIAYQVQHVPRISSLDAVRAAIAPHTMVDLDVRLYYADLVYGCGNVPQTTVDSWDTPPIKCAQHVQQSVDMCIQLPQA